MGHIAKPKPTAFYGALVRIYPQSFRNQFGTTMVQTFDDMLQSEQTKLGRLKIWTRTLSELPVSATKQHISSGKEMIMNRNMKILLGAVVVAVLLVSIGSYWVGSLNTRRSFAIEKVSSADLGDAMQSDNFYTKYGNAALLFTAVIKDVKNDGNATRVTFATNRPYAVVCEFGSQITAHAGQTVSVAAPGGSAERQHAGVLLHDCTLN